MTENIAQLAKKYDDLETRLREVEITQEGMVQQNKTLFEGFDAIKESMEKATDKIEKAIDKAVKNFEEKFVTKETLNAVVADGKYQKLWNGLVGAVVMFLVLAVIAFLSDKTGL